MEVLTFLVALVFVVASFVVIPTLSWGVFNPSSQLEALNERRGRGDQQPTASQISTHQMINVVVLVAWVVLVLALMRWLG